MHVVLRSRSLRFLLLGQTLSSLGDRALIIAFGIWAKELTGSDGAAGVAFFFVAFPTLLAPFAGVVIDRYPRRRVFLFANLIMAGVLLLGLLVHGSGQLWLLYLIILCYGFSTIFIDPTQSTIIASIVPKSELADANGLLQTVSGGVRLLAPLIGAGLFTVVGGRAVAVIDAATFVMAALCVLGVRVQEPQRDAATSTSWRQEISEGLRHVFRAAALRDVVLALALTMLVMGFSQTLIFAITDEGLHRPVAFVGVLSSVQGVGVITAGFAAGLLARRVGDVRVVTMGIACLTLAALLYLVPHVATAVGAAFVFGLAVCWTTVGLITTVQLRTAPELRGRALGTAMGAVSLPQTISIALGAGLSVVVDYRVLLGLMAGVTAACALWLAWRVPVGAAATEPRPVSDPAAD